jgi:hypothetical protein
MTRITVICNDSDYFLRHRLHVVERLAATGADVTVITGGKPMAKPSAGWRYEHMPIERFSFHPILDAKVIRRSLRHFRTEKPDAVHLITLKPAVLSGLAAVLARRLGSGPRRILITIPRPGAADVAVEHAAEGSRPPVAVPGRCLNTVSFVAAGRALHLRDRG